METIPKIYGFNKTSEAGMNVFAPSIFLQGCNLKCSFCFNAALAKSQMRKDDEVDLQLVKDHLVENSCEMIMISGGEPTMHKHLIYLIREFTSMGVKIGMSTHGIFHDRVKALLPELSYVALDIKSSSQQTYSDMDMIPDNNSFQKVLMTKRLLTAERKKRPDFTYEVRTTLYPDFVDRQSIHDIGKSLEKDDVWVLQQYRPTPYLYDMTATKDIDPYEFEELKEIVRIARSYTNKVFLRYV
jgi:pyruvate formate lyase activating enzyme